MVKVEVKLRVVLYTYVPAQPPGLSRIQEVEILLQDESRNTLEHLAHSIRASVSSISPSVPTCFPPLFDLLAKVPSSAFLFVLLCMVRPPTGPTPLD